MFRVSFKISDLSDLQSQAQITYTDGNFVLNFPSGVNFDISISKIKNEQSTPTVPEIVAPATIVSSAAIVAPTAIDEDQVVDEDAENEKFIRAVRKNNITKVEKMLAKGYDVNKKDIVHGSTPLMFACQKGLFHMVDFFLQRGDIEINEIGANGKTALIFAVQSKIPDIIEILIDAEADLNIKDMYGNTALKYALEIKNMEMVKLLMNAEATI
jgi:hypothetical protein